MTKRKNATELEDPALDSHEVFPPDDQPANDDATGTVGTKKKWVTRFGSFGDYQAGVRLVEDRENRRMTIVFAEKPSAEVRSLMKSEPYQYRYDSEEQLWYKPISPHTPTASRGQADELVLKVADMLRAEKGLPAREGAAVAM